MQTYFGGHRATSNVVRKLDASNFLELVVGYLNAAVPMRHTRKEFHALSDDEQRAVKNGPYICNCSFKPDPIDDFEDDITSDLGPGVADLTYTRSDANAEALNLIHMDLDCPKTGDVPAYLHEIRSAPEVVVGQLHPFNCAVYETVSSTKERPRLRIVVDADSLPPTKAVLKSAIATISGRIGLPDDFQGLKETSVISQPFFRPVTFAGDDGSPVLATRTNGRPFTEDDITDGDRTDAARVYGWDGEDVAVSDLDQLPLGNLTPEDVREPLMKIDPDCDYPQWVQIAAALKHQFRNEEQAEQAYQLFDEWSSNGSKYQGSDATYRKWKSFAPDKVGRRVVTIRSLFHHAQEAGWSSAKVSGIAKADFETWVNEQQEAGNKDVLLSEGATRIAALPYDNNTSDAMLVETLRRALVRLGCHGISSATLHKDLAKARAAKKAENQSDELPNWLRSYCYIAPLNRFHNVNKPADASRSVAAFDLENHNHPELLGKDGAPTIKASEFAIRSKGFLSVDSITYDPRYGDQRYFRYPWSPELTFVNEYNPNSVPELDSKNSDAAGRILDDHLTTLMGDERIILPNPDGSFDGGPPGARISDMLKWFLAWVVQRPGEKVPWMFIIQSAEGAGKSLLSDVLGAAIGEANSKFVNPTVMQTGSWNDWAYGAQLVVIEELMIKGKDRGATANTYKDFVSNPFIQLSRKFENSRKIPNLANAIAFTNDHSPIHLDESNRRYTFAKSPLQTKKQIVALTRTEHFQRVLRMKDKFPGAIRHHLMNLEIPDEFPRHGPAPYTRYTKQVINDCRNKALIRIEDYVAGSTDPLIQPDMILQERIEEVCGDALRNNHGAPRFLYAMGYEPWLDGDRVRLDDPVGLCHLWVHREHYDASLDDPVADANARLRKALKENSGYGVNLID